MTSFLSNSTQASNSRNNLNMIEFELENIFHLIMPRAEFRDKLKIDLLSYPKWKITLPKFLRYSFLLSAGIASGIIILFTGIRTVLTVVGAIKIFRQEKSKPRKGTTRSIRSQIITP